MKISEDFPFEARLIDRNVETMKATTQQTPRRIEGVLTPSLVEWTDRAQDTEGDSRLHRAVSTARSDLRCPHCNSIIYSRRNKLCGVCSQALPAELLFSPEEARRIEKLLQTEQLRRREWLDKSFKAATSTL